MNVQTLLSRKGAVLAGFVVSLSLIAAAGIGCGSSPSTNSGTSVSLPSGVSRPSAGVVQVIDALGDTVDRQNNPAPAPREVDISEATVRKDGQNLVFSMEVAAKLPDTKPGDTQVADWGFLLDTNGDGKPDWGIHAWFPPNSDNWTWGLYNENTKDQLNGPQFPGGMTHSGTTLTITVNPSAFGSPQNFKWVAYTDDASKIAVQGGQTTPMQQAGDHVPQNGWPVGSGWIDYP